MEDWKWKEKAAEGVWSVSRLTLWSAQERARARLYFLETVCSTSHHLSEAPAQDPGSFYLYIPAFVLPSSSPGLNPFLLGVEGIQFFF